MLISAPDALALLQDKTVKFIDSSWFMPNENRNPYPEYLQNNVTGYDIFLDLDSVADKNSPFKHMFPPLDIFENFCRSMGLSLEETLLIYDRKGIFSAPRAALTFMAYGFKNIQVIDGGFPALLTAGLQPIAFKQIKAGTKPALPTALPIFIDAEKVSNALKNKTQCVMDARSEARFKGTAPEPRPELVSGSMKGAINIPFTDMLTLDNCYKPISALEEIFKQKNYDIYDHYIFTCGSGMTACVVALGLMLIGKNLSDISIYDAAWCEWGNPHYGYEIAS